MQDGAIEPTTTDAGIPVASDEHSLTLGPNGPILLQGHYVIEQMANFNRQRIPERQPHAKGYGAFGYFEVANDVSPFTRAAVFQPGIRTDTLIRFSTTRMRFGKRSRLVEMLTRWPASPGALRKLSMGEYPRRLHSALSICSIPVCALSH